MLFNIFRISLQPFSISSREMVRGGDIRTAFFSNNSQKRIRFLLAADKIRLSAISGLSIIKASIRPLPLISLICLCLSKLRISFSLDNDSCISSLSVISLRVAKQADAITGLPPKVVIWPSSGFSIKVDIISLDAVNAPTGRPDAIPLPITRISGIQL